jgi:TonB family protein
MQLRILRPALLIALSTLPAATADLTVRYKLTFKAGEGMPPQAATALDPIAKQLPAETVTQFHGDMARSEIMGKTTLTDYARRQVTILDPKERRFATVPLDDYPNAVSASTPPLPPGTAEALRNLKVAFENKDTGRIDTIYGIRAEERAIVMTISMPATQGQSFSLRIQMGIWRPLADEMARVPELQEYAAWTARAKKSMDLAEMLSRIFAAMPGVGDQLRSALESFAKAGDGPLLKMEGAVSMPGLADLMRQQGAAAPAGLNPNGNLVEMTWELAELSTTPLADSLFAVPDGFQSVSMKDLSVTPAVAIIPRTAQAPATATPVPAIPAPPGDAFRVGGGVTAPALVAKVEPQYPQDALNARVEGTVVLAVVVGADGVARDLRVIRSLRPDLDQKAMEAVSQWKFQPGQKDGKPVNVQATVEVNFRLPAPPR